MKIRTDMLLGLLLLCILIYVVYAKPCSSRVAAKPDVSPTELKERNKAFDTDFGKDYRRFIKLTYGEKNTPICKTNHEICVGNEGGAHSSGGRENRISINAGKRS